MNSNNNHNNNKKKEPPEYEELKKFLKAYNITFVDEPATFDLLHQKFSWNYETISLTPLSAKWKEKLFVYSILYHAMQLKDYRKYSVESFISLPRAAILPALGLTPDRDALTLLFLNTSSILHQNKNLKDTIAEGRRITIGNILRWTQQILRTFLYLYNNYITFGPITIDKIFLLPDTTMVNQMNQWLHVSNALKRRYKIREEDFKDLPPPVELSGRQVWIDFTQLPDSNLHLYNELRNNDLEFSWKLAVK
jgi:hypothetical protein